MNNSLEQYIASDEAIGKLWEQIQNDNDEKDSSNPFNDVVINFQSGHDYRLNEILGDVKLKK